MTAADRAKALEVLGYTPRQAAFLALVAVHSGYCVRRQWLTFTGAPHGQCTVDFFAALVARGHARALPCGRHTHVYHLAARRLYAAIDEEHNRHRRLVAPAVITQKLMTLDIVLAHPSRVWYGTEREKVALVTEQYGVDRACLPAKVYHAREGSAPDVTRHFVDKFPVAVAPPSPVVTFTYINAWGQTGEGFFTFLSAYAPLFRQLPAVAVLYASAAPVACSTSTRSDRVMSFIPRQVKPPARVTIAYKVSDVIASLLKHDAAFLDSSHEYETHEDKRLAFRKDKADAVIG